MYYLICYRYALKGNKDDGCYLYKCDWRGKQYVRHFENEQKAVEYLRSINCTVTVYPPKGEAIDIWKDWPEEYRLAKVYG